MPHHLHLISHLFLTPHCFRSSFAIFTFSYSPSLTLPPPFPSIFIPNFYPLFNFSFFFSYFFFYFFFSFLLSILFSLFLFPLSSLLPFSLSLPLFFFLYSLFSSIFEALPAGLELDDPLGDVSRSILYYSNSVTCTWSLKGTYAHCHTAPYVVLNVIVLILVLFRILDNFQETFFSISFLYLLKGIRIYYHTHTFWHVCRPLSSLALFISSFSSHLFTFFFLPFSLHFLFFFNLFFLCRCLVIIFVRTHNCLRQDWRTICVLTYRRATRTYAVPLPPVRSCWSRSTSESGEKFPYI